MMQTDYTNEALEAALREYRKIYPEGTIPQEIEKKASLNVITGENKEIDTVSVCYWLRNQKEPLRFFEAEFNKQSKKVVVTKAGEKDHLSLSNLSDDADLGL